MPAMTPSTPSPTASDKRLEFLLSLLVDLTDHVHDVVNVVLYEDLDEIVLVGFSYGGAVATGAVEIAGRIRELVFLDAFVPRTATASPSSVAARVAGADAEPGLAGASSVVFVRRSS